MPTPLGSIKSDADISAISKIKALGTAVLSGATTTVNDTNVTATCKIHLTPQSGILNAGMLGVANLIAGVSFDIKSTNILDGRTVAYIIYEP